MIVPVPPLGEVKATLIEVVFNTVAIPIVGVFVSVVTTFDVLDADDVPLVLVATTVNV